MEAQGRLNIHPNGTLRVPTILVKQSNSVADVYGKIIVANTITVEDHARMEVYSSGSVQANEIQIVYYSSFIVDGATTMNVLTIRSYSDATLTHLATVSTIMRLQISEAANARFGGSSYNFYNLVFYDGTLHCLNKCKLTTMSLEMHFSTIQSNAVSSGCTPYYSSASIGASHAGCGGQAGCCPYDAITPYGEFSRPSRMGLKGGSCGSGDVSLGGGAIELVVSSMHSTTGPNYFKVNGGKAPANYVGAAGGGSGGSIFVSLPCHQAILGDFNFEANGGDAYSSASAMAYGGSAGRIAIHCINGNYNVNNFPQNYQAYGGKNVNTPGWGSAGTVYMTSNDAVLGRVSRLHVLENPTYFYLPAPSYLPATFVLFDPAVTYPATINLLVGSKSDVLFHSDASIAGSIAINVEIGQGINPVGALVNMTPTSLNAAVLYPPKSPVVPDVVGECLYYYGTLITN